MLLSNIGQESFDILMDVLARGLNPGDNLGSYKDVQLHYFCKMRWIVPEE